MGDEFLKTHAGALDLTALQKSGMAGLIPKIPILDIGKIVKILIECLLAGKKPDIHLVVDIFEKKFSICVYAGDKALQCTTLIDL